MDQQADHQALAALAKADYSRAQATEPCDLVMKGGVTSGVVYPTAMCTLAQKFHFRNIGGTSAGALAAVLAGAAEHERALATAANQQPVGFNRLAEVPGYLGAGTNLLDLFQPSRPTAPLYALALGLLRKKSMPAMFGLALRTYPLVALLTALAGAIVFVGLSVIVAYIADVSHDPNPHRHDTIVAIALAVAFLIALGAEAVTAVVLLFFAIKAAVLSGIPDNHFGLCTGSRRPKPDAPRPLTPWLADRIDYIAGRAGPGDQPDDSAVEPLTFGELYGPGDPANYPYPADTESPLLRDLNERSERRVNLEMVTTDVTEGRPYRLPFSPSEYMQFFYDPVELADFFPPRVLRRMANGATPIQAAIGKKTIALLPFPDAPDLPLIVAARMSMSFPILFSAVPLYAVDRHGLEAFNAAKGPAPVFRKTWFSDGGLSSNIPMHFFDGPVPRWPTFALNLRGFPLTAGGVPKPLDPKLATDREKVFPATDYDPDVAQFDEDDSQRLFGFANSLIDAMRNWNDNTLMQLKGYRERTVEIAMSGDEGGLNLVMPEQTLRSIMARGTYAGELFARTFAQPDLQSSPQWKNHRHLRLRSALLMQSEWTRRFRLAWNLKTLQPTYPEIVPATDAFYQIPFKPGQVASATQFAQHLADAPATIATGVSLTDLPLHSPELRPRPRV
jgi:predicted acylesterase/phospholipase RssA